MTESIRTVTRFSNGYVVYGNPGCVRTARRGQLKLVHGASAPAKDSSNFTDTVAARPGAGPVIKVSLDPMIEAGARTLAAWVEDKYVEAMALDFSTNIASITVPNLPPQEVVNMALMFLRHRGFRVDVNYPAVTGPSRTAVVSLRPSALG